MFFASVATSRVLELQAVFRRSRATLTKPKAGRHHPKTDLEDTV
jgi:hypothetical protein